jgi:hypothetical protein
MKQKVFTKVINLAKLESRVERPTGAYVIKLFTTVSYKFF